MEFNQEFDNRIQYIEKVLTKYIPADYTEYSKIVVDAMKYSLFSNGKRLRPIFLLESFNICNGDSKIIEPFIAAIEMIHTYSLIHDDLPAMDNDDLRRGKPTCHVKYGEDIAILAGDALLNYAFEIIINESLDYYSKSYLNAMKVLSKASGIYGMIGGQVADVLNEGKKIDIELLNYIHLHKTSALIEAAFIIGAMLAGSSKEEINIFKDIGRNIGLAFQIQDDLLDILSTEEELGKPIKSDYKNSKVTYVSLKGIDESNNIVKRLYNDALTKINKINSENSEFLVALLENLLYRKK